jgi:NADH dehydrogenase [ubiquinone] 1 alpha subcomplex assembly factor 6
MIIPADITAKHGVSQEDVFRHGPQAAGIEDAVFEFARTGNDHLLTARDMFKEEMKGGKVPGKAMLVFLAGVSFLLWPKVVITEAWLDTGSCVEFLKETGEG